MGSQFMVNFISHLTPGTSQNSRNPFTNWEEYRERYTLAVEGKVTKAPRRGDEMQLEEDSEREIQANQDEADRSHRLDVKRGVAPPVPDRQPVVPSFLAVAADADDDEQPAEGEPALVEGSTLR